jgi:hypothetical protein
MSFAKNDKSCINVKCLRICARVLQLVLRKEIEMDGKIVQIFEVEIMELEIFVVRN